jgi:hypothetical protein
MNPDFSHHAIFYDVLIITEINAVTDSPIMLYFDILDGIAVYPFRTMKQWWEDEAY